MSVKKSNQSTLTLEISPYQSARKVNEYKQALRFEAIEALNYEQVRNISDSVTRKKGMVENLKDCAESVQISQWIIDQVIMLKFNQAVTNKQVGLFKGTYALKRIQQQLDVTVDHYIRSTNQQSGCFYQLDGDSEALASLQQEDRKLILINQRLPQKLQASKSQLIKKFNRRQTSIDPSHVLKQQLIQRIKTTSRQKSPVVIQEQLQVNRVNNQDSPLGQNIQELREKKQRQESVAMKKLETQNQIFSMTSDFKRLQKLRQEQVKSGVTTTHQGKFIQIRPVPELPLIKQGANFQIRKIAKNVRKANETKEVNLHKRQFMSDNSDQHKLSEHDGRLNATMSQFDFVSMKISQEDLVSSRVIHVNKTQSRFEFMSKRLQKSQLSQTQQKSINTTFSLSLDDTEKKKEQPVVQNYQKPITQEETRVLGHSASATVTTFFPSISLLTEDSTLEKSRFSLQSQSRIMYSQIPQKTMTRRQVPTTMMQSISQANLTKLKDRVIINN